MSFPTLPSPPTDNLYKFMAMSGVVLLIVAPIFCAQFYVSQAERTRKAFETLGESFAPADYEMAKVKFENDKPITDEEKNLIEKYDALKKEASSAGSEFLIYDRFSRVVTVLSILLGLLGCLLSWFGFYLWYLRVQKPLDRILLKEARTHESSA
jgi:hypothetical protein